MSGYEVEIDQIRGAAAAARSCGDQLGQMDTAAAISSVPAALPGSRSGTSINKLAGTWRGELDWVSRGFLGHGTSLAKSADLYAANETAAAEVFAPVNADDDGRGAR